MIWTSRVSGLLIVAAVLAWAALAGGQPQVFVDVPALVLVVGLVVGGLVAGDGLKAVCRAFGGDAAFCDEAAEVLGHARRLSWAAGVLGMVIGVVAVFSDLADPGAMLRSLAFLVLPVVYGGVLGEFVFGTLRAWVQRRMIKLACVGPEQG